MSPLRIWVDIVNSPHVLILEPIIAELWRRGHEVIVTAKDHSQTAGLLRQKGIGFRMIGGHGGKSSLGKAASLLSRTGRLMILVRRRQIDLSVCHGAREQILVSKLLGIPNVTLFDYEFSEHFIKTWGATLLITPDVIPLERLHSLGYPLEKVYQYRGLKEHLYLKDPGFDPTFLRDLGIAPEKILIVFRPPATLSHYHNRRSEDIIRPLFRHFDRPEVSLVVLPRYASQLTDLREMTSGMENQPLIPAAPLDGPRLLYHADLAVSGGGTMIREAAVLGTPAYSIFTGKPGAVDEYLVCQNRLTWVRDCGDIEKIHIAKKNNQNAMILDPDRVPSLCDRILSTR
jgi:predicted glycosyltransferase